MLPYKIVTGRSNPELAQKVVKRLETELSEVSIKNFPDGEIWVKYEENIRGVDVFIIQSTYSPPADHLLELLILIDAAKRASARRVTAVIPYFGYARQDRKDQPRVSITAKLIANLITRAGADRVITFDLHSAQIQGYFDIPFDHLYASPVIIKVIKNLEIPNLTIASPDVGGIKTARAYAKRLNADLVLTDKRRNRNNQAEIMHIIGEVEGRNICIVDDIIDSGGTFINCANALKEKGALDIIGVCVHPVLSGNAVDKIEQAESIKKIYVTDTIPLKRKSDKIEVISISETLAEAIIRTHTNRSIASLFEFEIER